MKIDPDASLKAAALISCGLSTGFGSAVDRAKVRPGETVVVVGCGGVGSGALQGARLAGARQIVAVDPLPFKLEKATKIGATHTAASMLEANLILPELTEGRMADVVVLTPGVLTGDLHRPGLALASKDGRVVTTAIAPFNQNEVDLNLFNFAMFNQALLGHGLRLGQPTGPDPEPAAPLRGGHARGRRPRSPGSTRSTRSRTATTTSRRAPTSGASSPSTSDRRPPPPARPAARCPGTRPGASSRDGAVRPVGRWPVSRGAWPWRRRTPRRSAAPGSSCPPVS